MNTTKPLVLIAPLDWGLGHTVRCIPIIRALQENGCDVVVACDSKQKQILSKEFPVLRFEFLEGYNIMYGKNRLQTLLRICLQAPRILIAINRENHWLRKFLLANKVNAIISDNRYGFFSDKALSVFMTHQLGIISGLGKVIDDFIQRVVYFYINKFAVCWVPDWVNGERNAGGKLSHPVKLPKSAVKYIGCLSRLQKCMPLPCTTDLLIVLSGPEPQRTILEEIILGQLTTYTGTAVVVRGVFDSTFIESFANVMVMNNASTAELNHFACNAEIIISRSGYTSIMDILKLGKKSILIPTPGQAEQEYLGSYLHEEKLAYSVEQKNFYLHTALKAYHDFVPCYVSGSMDQYKKVIEEFVRSLKD